MSYYGSFLLSLHQIKTPLNKLLTKDTKWSWPITCQKSFDKIKSLIKLDQLLTHFDPNKKIVVAADASNHGVGVVISHTFTDGTGVVKNGLSPEETLMGRQLRTTLDTLRPQQQRQQPSPNKKLFPLGTPVFVWNYRSGQANWVPGITRKTKGQFLYEVQVRNQFWIWHKNQIHPIYTAGNLVDSMPTIPFDLFMDAFELPSPSPPPCEQM